MAKTHKDLEFQLEDQDGRPQTFKSFEEASAAAVAIAAGTGSPVNIDVLTLSKAAARACAVDYVVEVFEEDPEASVHERIVVKAESQGRVA